MTKIAVLRIESFIAFGFQSFSAREVKIFWKIVGHDSKIFPTFAPLKTKINKITTKRKDAGVVDRGGLENRCSLTGTQGSNPCLSAKSKLKTS